ncbi:hypothetical protein Zmor_009848 [Zophobas morio]|uniref:Uncharacterized protein n=1 Tax=Zophobas morio TaxID=2755281 RepID=A0AA38MIZ5_9CUCU|nr:hypothetical protein Zmor_009848 [Zophobas morio]
MVILDPCPGIFALLFLNIVQPKDQSGGVISLKRNQVDEVANSTPVSFSDQKVPESFDESIQFLIGVYVPDENEKIHSTVEHCDKIIGGASAYPKDYHYFFPLY